jgi:hypothetical protein
LQILLITIDMVGRRPGAGPRLLAASGQAADNPCAGITSGEVLIGAGASMSGAGPVAALLGIELREWITKLSVIPGGERVTHYGPPGHASKAGRPLKFGVHAEVTEDVPARVRCGSLGVTFPPRGPYPGRRLSWFTRGGLEKYGEVDYDRATDREGNAYLRFVPKNEKIPGFGQVVQRDGSIITSTVGPGGSGGAVSTSSVSQLWAVERHKPRGFKFQVTLVTAATTSSGDTAQIEYDESGRACGEDPYAENAWQIHIKGTVIANGVRTAGPDVTLPMTLQEGAVTQLNENYAFGLVVGPGPSVQVRVILKLPADPDTTYTPASYDTLIQATEDTSCPDNGE